MKRLIIYAITILAFLIPMNVFATDVEEPTIYDIASGDVYTHGELVLPYRYVLPEDYTPEKQYPLILFLHAENERGNNNAYQLRHCVDYIRVKQPQSIILAPQCNVDNQWVDTPIEGGNYSINEIPESDELQAVIALLSKFQTDFSVDSNRISLVGVSMGGYGVWDLMMRHNELFSVGVVMAGGGDPSQAEILKDTPMFVFHGDTDEVISIEHAHKMVQSIYEINGTDIRFFEKASYNHEVCYELLWSSGVMETLDKYYLSDRYKARDEKDKEELPKEKTEVITVVDAGIKKNTPRSVFFIGVVVPILIGIVVVTKILKKVKF